MNYRKPVDDSGAFAPWLRALRNKSGVYLIRSVGGFWTEAELIYIGESHTGRLYKTITRHFQSWDGRRAKYDPKQCVVAVRSVRDPARAIDLQYELIQRLRPRDNEIKGESVTDEEAPF